MERRKVPKIVGVSLDEAKEILEKANIEIEKEKKKIDIFEKSGTVVKVEPKEETELKKNEKVVLYVSDRKPILIIILLILLCTFLGRTSLGKTIIRGTEDKVIRVLNLSKPTAPEITGGSKEWSQSQVVKVKKDSYAKKGLAYYEYCVGTNLNKCVWKKTNTKNVKVSKTGKWKVVFRGVDKEGNTSINSNIEEVYIDNNNPIINKVSIKNKKVNIEAIDKESGIKKYYYSIDGKEYKETRTEFEIKDKTEKIYIKVEDKAGNKTTVEVPVEKENEINSTSTTTKVTNEKTTGTTTKSGGVTNPVTDATTTTSKIDSTETTKKTSTTTTKKGFEYDIPKINLDKVPVEFVYGSDYELPSYVDFGNDEGTYKCVVEGKEETTTKNLAIGKHLIVCEAESKHNKRTMVEKEVEVKVKSGEEEIWDGWIRLNLSYPDNSTNWEWRIGKEGEIRDGYDFTGWQDYTGPILVKLEDVKDVYIRYDLLGETYIIAPNGKVAVDIEPEKYTLEGNEKTKVKIVYERNVETKEYRVAGGEWEEYTGEFEVGKNTLIEARGIRNEKVYDSDGNYLYTKKVTGTDTVFIGEANATNGGTANGGSNGSFEYEVVERPNGTYTTKPKEDVLPSTYLEGPIIKTNTNELVEEVKVSIETKEKARKVYVKVGSGNYQEYTGEISVSENTLIRAYYVRDEDGKTSETSYYYIQNIKKASKPYVRIDATPDYLSETVDKVKVKISGSNYKTLEYSLDGVIYEEYKGELTVNESKTIYAKGTNEFGETIESLDITTSKSPKEKENIEISIEVSPRKEEVEGLVNKAKVQITYEANAEKRYYKLGYYGTWKEYTGEFEIKENTTIYAYASGTNASGSARKSVDYLTTGISSPIINVEPYGKAQQVKVSIEYASTAEITRYKIGSGDYRDYNGPFYVYENETIYAYNKDELGNEATSEYKITNIVSAPNYVAIDKGKYYIIKLNYPETSNNQEYKWKSDGTWKGYNGYGILLIKPEYKEEFKDIKDGIKVEDEYGKEIIFTDHYYFIDVPFSELMENLYMRWDTEKISAPKIIETPEEVTREASISIVYNKALVKKLYKIVYEDGEETEWIEYEKPFKIDKNKATIYAKGITRSESESKVGSKTITNIDDTDPEIKVKGNFEKAARQINVTVNAIDEFGIDKVKWAKGEQTKEYFKKNGNGIRNGSSFKVEENGKYTIYAVDYVGNETIKVIDITNIDKEAPNIRINILTESYGTEAEIEIEYGDSVKKEYKIGENGRYKEYTDTIKIKSNDVLDLVNEDGSITIYGKGVDEAGNEREVSEKVYILDLDAPKEPVIVAGAGYPILTEYGVKLGSKSYITYDDRDDIDNYYSIDEGKTWKVYTGPFEITSGSIKAKSVKKESGLTIETTKKVDMPSDALGPEAYDGDEKTLTMSGYLNISKEMWNKKIEILDIEAQYGDKERIEFLDESDNILLTKMGVDGTQIIEIPENTYRIKFTGGGSGNSKARIREVSVYSQPEISVKNYYPKLTEYEVEQGYNEVTINYFPTSVQRLYRINDDEWKNYEDKPIRLEIGDKIEAKGVDKSEVETKVSFHISKLVEDALGLEAYDGDEKTLTMSGYLNISKEMWNKKIEILDIEAQYGDKERIEFLDESDNILLTKMGVDGTQIIEIPENTYRIKFTGGGSGNSKARIREVSVYSQPEISVKNYYPKLTEYEVEHGYNEVSINYFQTSIQRLYRVNEEDWTNYEDKPIRLEIGDKIEAKGVDKSGVETKVSFYISELVEDALGPEAYDGDEKTLTMSGYLKVLESMYGKYVKIIDIQSQYSSRERIEFLDESDNILLTKMGVDGTQIIEIPENTYRIKFTGGGSGNTKARVKEVLPNILPVITQTSYYPTIRKTGIAKSYADVKITYLSYFAKKLYSIDNGSTWLDYTEPIKVKVGDVIKAKAIDKDGKETDISTYTVTGLTDNLDDKAFDKDQTTSVTLSSKQTKFFSLDNVDNEVLRIYTTGTVNAGAYIKFYDKDNQELSTITLNTDLTSLVIPVGSVKAGVYSGTSSLVISEIDLRDKLAASDAVPIIDINTSDWSVEKMVTIKYYNDDYQNEYSLDNGTTWNEYTDSFKLEEPTNVIARTVLNDKIIGSSNFIITKIDPTEPVVEIEVSDTVQLGYDLALPTYYKKTTSGTTVECKDGNTVVTNIRELDAGKHKLTCIAKTGAGRQAKAEKTINVIATEDIESESLLKAISNDDIVTGRYKVNVNDEVYGINIIVLNGNQHFTRDMVFGNSVDVASEDTYAQNMVVVKVNGDLEIDSGVTVSPYYTEYGGPKGFALYVTGKLTNNGTIDNSHGAKAEGQNVYLWKNADGTYEKINATGAAGASKFASSPGVCSVRSSNGTSGTNGTDRDTAGGGSGGGTTSCSQYEVKAGGTGTSYSGGIGSGGANACKTTGEAVTANGTGGTSCGSNSTAGAGNPTGGTGGLLIIYANEYKNNGKLTAIGATSKASTAGTGGSSGGGSINIFTNQSTGIDQLGIITDARYEEMKGSTSVIGGAVSGTKYQGGAGGTGTVNIGEIRNNQYYDLKDIIEQDKEQYSKNITITGDTILSIINDNNLKSGYYNFVANGEKYPVHMITYDGNQHFTESQTFGDAYDVATASTYAQNMVIVKVNGDLEIDSGVTVSPYYNEYGGPKGFALYVTGKLINNGTIDNSHGAKAEGQNVYLWKNEDGTYEYVPAIGSLGGKKFTSASGVCSVRSSNGSNGDAGTGRQTAGGGSGGGTTSCSQYEVKAGGTGTSYSGGVGSGGANACKTTGEAVTTNGTGGTSCGSNSTAGAGNPAGGTGGLLIIYSAGYENNGTISSMGATSIAASSGTGGSSGGGSINIFTEDNIENNQKGTLNVNGGLVSGTRYKGGAGGTGTVTFTQIKSISLSYDYKYPNITSTFAEKEKIMITIYYSSLLTKKLYSVDNGMTWLEYTKPFESTVGNIILVKGIKNDNTETDVITYEVTSKGGIPYVAIDGDKETNEILNKNENYVFTISEDTIGKNLRFYLGSEPSSDATIKIYDKNNTELLSTTFVNNLTVINIPTDSYKFVVNAGSKELTVNDINLVERTNLLNELPNIAINDTNWTSSKTIEITYPEGYKNEYSLDLGTTWNEYTEPITINEETTIFARIVKDEKVFGSSGFVITTVDSFEPVVEINSVSKIGKEVDYEIPYTYKVGKSEVKETACKINDTEITNTNTLDIGKYEIQCSVISNSGMSKTVTKEIEIFEITEDLISNFDYTGSEQTYTASKSGLYLIETWGASGGCALNNGVTNCTKISYGGYSYGTTFLTAGNTLYINVGGKGTDGILKSNSPGGYNGGGYGTWDNSDDESSGGGGGATHIALRTGLLSTLENYKNDIIVVSGGGGGQSWTYAAGSGGGYNGVTTSTTNQSEVSQDKGYAFGQGQDAKGTASNDGVGGGGGGFFGGYMNNVGGKSSGSGGSGYIGNTLLTNKAMYCYNCSESTEESTKTIKTTNVSETATSKYAKSGNGYARITYIGE